MTRNNSNATARRHRAYRAGSATMSCLAIVTAVAATPAAAVTKPKRATSATTTVAKPSRVTTAPAVITTAPPTTAVPAPKGPLRIMVTYIETTTADNKHFLAAAQARADAQNAQGGVNGRRIEIVPCNAKFDLAAAEECARSAASAKVDAFIDVTLVAPPASSGLTGGVSDAPTVVPILASAGVPWLGIFSAAGGQEATSPVAFPTTSTFVSLGGAAVTMVNEGCQRIAFVGTPTGREAFRRGLASKGREPVFEGLFPFGGDPTVVISALAARNVDCVYLGATDPGIKAFAEAADRTGQRFRFAWVNDIVSERTMAQLGPVLDGSIVSGTSRSSLDLADPAVRQYRTELDTYYPGRRYDSGAFLFWGGVDLVIQAVRRAPSEPSVLSALRSFKGDTALFGPLDLSRTLSDPAFGRMFVTNAFVYRIVNGKPVRIGDAIDLAPLFSKAP